MGDGAGDGGKGGGLSTGTVQIIVAIIGVSGVISAALFGNWDKIFGAHGPASSGPQQQQASVGPDGDPTVSAKPPQVDAGAVNGATSSPPQTSAGPTSAAGSGSGAGGASVAVKPGIADLAKKGPVAIGPLVGKMHLAPSVTGTWRDTDGYSFEMTQTGSAVSFRQFYKGALQGSASGTINGTALSYDYRTDDDKGHCTAQLAATGNEISGHCKSESGNSWPFTVTRS